MSPENSLVGRLVLDAENIAGPDRRKHTGSQCLQAYRAARAENFGRKLKLITLASLCHDRHGD